MGTAPLRARLWLTDKGHGQQRSNLIIHCCIVMVNGIGLRQTVPGKNNTGQHLVPGCSNRFHPVYKRYAQAHRIDRQQICPAPCICGWVCPKSCNSKITHLMMTMMTLHGRSRRYPIPTSDLPQRVLSPCRLEQNMWAVAMVTRYSPCIVECACSESTTDHHFVASFLQECSSRDWF